MTKPNVLIQIDSDQHASTFDSMVAIDSGIDHLLCRSNVSTEQIEGLVHGAMFTRGPKDLKHTAIFFGGSDVAKTDELFQAAQACFFGPMRVSVFADPNGSNTTAAAAVLCAQRHVNLDSKTTTILGGTGPVGQRIAKIISESANAADIRICSRRIEKAQEICDRLTQDGCKANLVAYQTGSADEAVSAVKDSQVVFAAGAAGVELLPLDWQNLEDPPQIAIDLNAVPPAGIAGVEVMDSGVEKNNTTCYGAIGVGGLKMKIHKRAIELLFESNDQVLDVSAIYNIGRSIEG